MLPAILGLLTPAIKPLLDLIPNPAAKEKARMEFELKVKEQETEMLKLFMQSDTAQAEINKIEAGHTSLFVAGWRPFIGWVCGSSFAWAFLGQPLLVFLFNAFGHPLTNLPAFDISTMSSVLLGMLGMGGLRTFEKYKGVASK